MNKIHHYITQTKEVNEFSLNHIANKQSYLQSQKKSPHPVSHFHNLCKQPLMWDINSLRPSDAYMRQWISHQWLRQWLRAWSAPSHYLNQWQNIVNWTLKNKIQWNFNRNSYIFIHENAFENMSGKWQPFCLGLNVLTDVNIFLKTWFSYDRAALHCIVIDELWEQINL